MVKKIIVFSLLLLFLVACQQEQFQITTRSPEKKALDEQKMIDTTAVLENYEEGNIPEFKGGYWAIAVHSLKTGYTYYYDSNNKFLGRER